MITILLFLLGYRTILVENQLNLTTLSIGIVTAYTSEESQTDSTPFITASNQKVRDGIVANNCLAFGSKVEIAGKTYEVQDRKNKRYDCEWYDIWLPSRKEALEF